MDAGCKKFFNQAQLSQTHRTQRNRQTLTAAGQWHQRGASNHDAENQQPNAHMALLSHGNMRERPRVDEGDVKSNKLEASNCHSLRGKSAAILCQNFCLRFV